MSLSASTVLEVRTGGSDTNGAGFVTGASGTDWSQQNSAQYALTNGHYVSGTTILTASASADMIGNLAYIAGGTGSITGGWYQITAQVTGTSLTLDRSTGLVAGTGITINIGGALLSPAIATSIVVAGNIVYVQYNASVFSITSASQNVVGGCLLLNVAAIVVGYNSTRTPTNTDANQPALQLNVSTATLLTGTSNEGGFFNLICDGNSQTSAKPSGGGMIAVSCLFKNFNVQPTSFLAMACQSTSNSVTVFIGWSLYCEAYANTAAGFAGTGAQIVGCLSYGNTGASSDGFDITQGTFAVGCVAYSNGRDGFYLTDSGARCGGVFNCVASSNSGYGFVWGNGGTGRAQVSINNAAYNNTLGAQNGTAGYSLGFITLSADPFVSASGNNFALNNNPGGGASLQAAAYPVTFPRGTTASYGDVGPAQLQNSLATVIARSLSSQPAEDSSSPDWRRVVLVSSAAAALPVPVFSRRTELPPEPEPAPVAVRVGVFPITTIAGPVLVNRMMRYEEQDAPAPASARASVIFSPSIPVLVKRAAPREEEDVPVLCSRGTKLFAGPLQITTAHVINKITNIYMPEEA